MTTMRISAEDAIRVAKVVELLRQPGRGALAVGLMWELRRHLVGRWEDRPDQSVRMDPLDDYGMKRRGRVWRDAEQVGGSVVWQWEASLYPAEEGKETGASLSREGAKAMVDDVLLRVGCILPDGGPDGG